MTQRPGNGGPDVQKVVAMGNAMAALLMEQARKSAPGTRQRIVDMVRSWEEYTGAPRMWVTHRPMDEGGIEPLLRAEKVT